VQVVEATNRAPGGSSVVVARRLPSGNTILTFEGNTKVEEHTKETAWVRKAFGDTAEIRRREFTVISKGLLAARLQAIHSSQELLKELQGRTPGITRYKAQLPKSSSGKYAVVVIHFSSVVAAQEACRKGIAFEA